MRNWFKRRNPEFEIITNDVPMSTVWRWYLYDTSLTDDINEVSEIIGLSRISEEGEIKEEEDSERRMMRTAPLFPFLDSMAELSANVMSAIHAKELLDADLEDTAEELTQMLSDMHSIYKAVALSTLVGTISGALELGILQSNTISSNTYLLEKDTDD